MTIDVGIMIVLLAAHWLADFVFQTDEMAVNKSSSNMWLGKHIGIYSLVMFGLLCLLVPVSGPFFGRQLALYVIYNGCWHFVTDYITSRMTSYYWKKEERHKFFVTIGFDQLVHAVTLIVTWAWLMV